MAEGRGPGFYAGFFLGGIVGAALAFMFAPRMDEETREILLEKGAELRDRAEEISVKARASADELMQMGRTVMEEQRSRVEQAIQAGKNAADETTTEMLTELDKAQHEGNQP